MATYEEIAATVKQQYQEFIQIERDCIALFHRIFARMNDIMQIPEGKLAWAPVDNPPGGRRPVSDAVPQNAILLQNDGYYRAIWDLRFPSMIASFVVQVRAVGGSGFEVKLSDVPNGIVSREYDGLDELIQQLSVELEKDAPGHFEDLHRRTERQSLGFRLSGEGEE
jgi:hypothetical protein